jgi:3-dehydroquinate synthase
MIQELINRCVMVKGHIVEADPEERGTQRALLNLGHTFGHALETAAGLGTLTHGEAVAWGIARSVELGRALGITPPERVERILTLLRSYAYETGTGFADPGGSFHYDPKALLSAMEADKKKKAGQRRFIVPDADGARLITLDTDENNNLILKILEGRLDR